ncbi:hypothetical protein E2562_029164 [Oryza meyeriana var. granulata]|uniref:Uncharacterized protein n=1 Tax=Oryza meyeriana var. granulata TaxID=110450 RepID=A0A6G1E4H2_9ORYZ|nr:hypothetical protein E2562_029164 [Oryza meyeriana var. granulata]
MAIASYSRQHLRCSLTSGFLPYLVGPPPLTYELRLLPLLPCSVEEVETAPPWGALVLQEIEEEKEDKERAERNKNGCRQPQQPQHLRCCLTSDSLVYPSGCRLTGAPPQCSRRSRSIHSYASPPFVPLKLHHCGAIPKKEEENDDGETCMDPLHRA